MCTTQVHILNPCLSSVYVNGYARLTHLKTVFTGCAANTKEAVA
jgi:hypothetical protein